MRKCFINQQNQYGGIVSPSTSQIAKLNFNLGFNILTKCFKNLFPKDKESPGMAGSRRVRGGGLKQLQQGTIALMFLCSGLRLCADLVVPGLAVLTRLRLDLKILAGAGMASIQIASWDTCSSI